MKSRQLLTQNSMHHFVTLFLAITCLSILLCLSGCHALATRGAATGRYILADNGAHLILIQEGYSGEALCSMGTKDGDKSMFEDLQTGDRIRITCDGYRETYPMQTTVFSCKKLASGTIKDIPQEHIDFLTEHGWLDAPVIAEYSAEVDGKQVNIQLKVPSLWQAEEQDVQKVPNSEEWVSCGIILRSTNDPEVEVEIVYYNYSFAMCGTGVDFNDITMDNGQPATLATEKRNDGGVWCTLIMGDITRDDSFVAHYHLTKDQKEQYEDQILAMLLGVEFQAE